MRLSQNRLVASLLVSSTNIVVLTVNSVASLIVARSLPHEEYGEVAYYLSTFLLISLLAGLGLTDQATRIVAEKKGRGDTDSLERSVAELFGLRVASAFFVLVPIGAWTLLSGQRAILLCGFAAVLALFLDFCAGIFRGHQYYAELASTLLVQPLLYLALLLTHRPQSSESVLGLLLASFGFATGFVLVVAKVRRLLPLAPSIKGIYRNKKPLFLGSAGVFYVLALTQVAFGTLGTFVLGRMGLFAAAALLSIALTAIRLLNSLLPPAVVSVYYPRATALLRKGQKENAQRLFTRFLLPMAVVALGGAAILFYFGDLLIPLLYTAEYREAVPFLRILAPTGALLAMDSLMIWTMVSHAKGHVAARWYLVRVLMLVICGFTIQGILGADRAALSWSLAYLLVTVLLFGYQLVAVGRHTGYSFSVIRIAVLGIAVTFAAWGARSRLPNLIFAGIDWLGNLLIVCAITAVLVIIAVLWSCLSKSAREPVIGRPREVTILLWLVLPASLLSVPQTSDAIEALYAFGKHLIHRHENGLTVAAMEYPPVLLKTLPPTDPDAWETQRTQTVAPYIPAKLGLDVRPLSGVRGVPAVRVTVHNGGTADAPGLVLVAQTGDEGEAVEEIFRTPVDLLAGENEQLWIDVPLPPGRSVMVQVHLEDGEGNVLAVADPATVVAPPLNPDAVLDFSHVPILLPLVALFATLVSLATVLATADRSGHSSK